MIHIRRAGSLDASQMAEMLNDIISKGGTTAFVQAVTALDIKSWMLQSGSNWHLAENDKGEVLGFQWFAPHKDLATDAADIASFVKIGATGLGIGSALFERTKRVAKNSGYKSLHAIIRADNESGLTYYQSRGFEDYRRLPNTKLDDGTIVDKIWKRYELTR